MLILLLAAGPLCLLLESAREFLAIEYQLLLVLGGLVAATLLMILIAAVTARLRIEVVATATVLSLLVSIPFAFNLLMLLSRDIIRPLESWQSQPVQTQLDVFSLQVALPILAVPVTLGLAIGIVIKLRFDE